MLLSTLSSWNRVAVWISSTTTAPRTAWSRTAPNPRAARSRRVGRKRLPKARCKWAPTAPTRWTSQRKASSHFSMNRAKGAAIGWRIVSSVGSSTSAARRRRGSLKGLLVLEVASITAVEV
jgi:hypothetical protein